MTNVLNQSTGLPRLTNTKFLSMDLGNTRSSLRKLMAATVVLAGLLLLSAPKASATTIDVTFVWGGPQPGVVLHLYKGDTGRCQCLNGQCDLAPDATAITDKQGKARFPNLMGNTVYTVCVQEQCSGPSPCVDPSQCSFSGWCWTVTTGKGTTKYTFGLI